MSKHIYKYVALFALMAMSILHAEQNPTKEQKAEQILNSIIKKYDGNISIESLSQNSEELKEIFKAVKDSNMSDIKSVPAFSPRGEIMTKEGFINTFERVSGKMLTQEQKELILKELDSIDTQQKRVDSFFYFYSESIPIKAADNFLVYFNQIKEKYPEIKGYVVINGFPPYNIYEFMQKFNRDKFGKGILKIHPILYENFGVERVPAFGLAKCLDDDKFNSKECDYKYVLKGDVNLAYFLDKITEEDKQYQKYRAVLREPES